MGAWQRLGLLCCHFLALVCAEISVKARVEAGEGVAFFDDRLSCLEDADAWRTYRELVDYTRLHVFGDDARGLSRMVAEALSDRTANVTEVLQCTVGVIAGYHLLARKYVSEGKNLKAYRLLQLALIWVFTLRNGLQVPTAAAREWATQTDEIVHGIKALKHGVDALRKRRLSQLPSTPLGLRLPDIRIAIVSICAYPKDHPMLLRDLTPGNRRAYAQRHGYGLHVHMVHPMPGEGIHIQHAKLRLMADYLRTGDYDWVAWFDCDSILMNFDKTLDYIIHRYARTSARASFLEETPKGLAEEAVTDEPLEDEVLQAFLTNVGSCNTAEGCNATARISVNPRVQYRLSVRTAMIDMVGEDEKLGSIRLASNDLGECNPAPEDDYDCGFHDCFTDFDVPMAWTSSGSVLLEVWSVRTHNDCRCNLLTEDCHSAALAAYKEAEDGHKIVEPSYGMFVKFTLTPVSAPSLSSQGLEDIATAGSQCDIDGCSCWTDRDMACSVKAHQSSLFGAAIAPLIRRFGSECIDGHDILLGLNMTQAECLDLCLDIAQCDFVSVGTGYKNGSCYWEMGPCLHFEEDEYTVYDVRSMRRAQKNPSPSDCSVLCSTRRLWSQRATPGDSGTEKDEEVITLPALPVKSSQELKVDSDVDLLITEEGWGFSSANWLIRRSNWSIDFLDRAFKLCHEEMPLFGDQDAMIHLLLNPQALKQNVQGDPLDSHVVVVPQREFNAYDALNAHYMGCDAYQDGDLLVTFPGCKDPETCNPLFLLAAETAGGARPTCDESSSKHGAKPSSVAHLRLFGPPELAGALFEASRKARN